MKKEEALRLIDDHKNALVNPVEMLDWVWLRVMVLCIDDAEWEKAMLKGTELLSR